jgi:hypothetical protein
VATRTVYVDNVAVNVFGHASDDAVLAWYRAATGRTDAVLNAFCATGQGGGVDPTCSPGESGAPQLSEKAQRAKESHKLVDKEIQRYSEEHNEPRLAASVGGLRLDDNEEADVVLGSVSRPTAGIELKTMVDNKYGKITMKRSAMQRKADWEKRNKADFHTVVFDDQNVFNARGAGKHDESKRVIYYRRGYGSFRVKTMHKVEGYAELKKLLAAPDHKLPEAARRQPDQKRGQLA